MKFLGSTTSFAEDLFEKKRKLIRENKLPTSTETHRKFCNMTHIEQWFVHICPNQKEPEFGQGFRAKTDRKDKQAGPSRGQGPQGKTYFPQGYQGQKSKVAPTKSRRGQPTFVTRKKKKKKYVLKM